MNRFSAQDPTGSSLMEGAHWQFGRHTMFFFPAFFFFWRTYDGIDTFSSPHFFKIYYFYWKRVFRCPQTLFISHENANFLFSVYRVVQGEAKTPKIMGCCRANFAFLHALKIGTFRGKWTLEWVFRTSHFIRLALFNSELAFFLACSSTMPSGNCKKMFELDRRTEQKITFCLYDWKPI